MPIDPWLPIGHPLPNGNRCGKVLHADEGWQIVETGEESRALLATASLRDRWLSSGLLEPAQFAAVEAATTPTVALMGGVPANLAPVAAGRSPNSAAEAMAFARSLGATRAIDRASPLQDAIYAGPWGRLLPTYRASVVADDALVLGSWLTGGAGVSAMDLERLGGMLTWLPLELLREMVLAAGLPLRAAVPADASASRHPRIAGQGAVVSRTSGARFELPGRPALEAFFNEHVVDIVTHRERYRALGIDSPSAVVLHGPPGCGKTYAVERLVDFLGWPRFSIEAASVASAYIHETSRKVAGIFEQAMAASPSVIVIDEMESFLADRGMGSGHHRVEEVGEFLRRIPEALRRQVLILGMTNRIEMIDPAILRSGRFDHIVRVDPASETEIRALLVHLLSRLPHDVSLDLDALARDLADRPLSDVDFVVRESGRLTARAGRDRIDAAAVAAALQSAPSRDADDETNRRRIGFV